MKPIAPVPRAELVSRLAFERFPLACLAVPAAVAAVVGPAWSERIAPLPWIVSLVIVGLPHGATDFAVSRTTWHGWRLASLWLAYVASMVMVAAGFTAAPACSLALFTLLSAWHFGLADADARGVPPDGRAVAAVAHGCLVLAAPLAVWPAATADVASRLIALTVDGPVVSPDQARALGGMLGVVGILALVWELLSARHGDGGRVPRGLGEIGVITAVGSLTHPLFAVGLYFLIWHAWRQMAPLARDVTGVAPRSWPELGAAIVRIHAAALPLLLPAWAAIGTAWWAWSPTHSLLDLAVLSIGGYLVVTPAHELLGVRRASRLATRHCTTDLLPSVEPPIGAPAGMGRPAVGMSSRCSSSRT